MRVVGVLSSGSSPFTSPRTTGTRCEPVTRVLGANRRTSTSWLGEVPPPIAKPASVVVPPLSDPASPLEEGLAPEPLLPHAARATAAADPSRKLRRETTRTPGG